jgi:hypothetical protein
VGNKGPVLEVTFDKDRETKNPVRFEERPGKDPPIVGRLGDRAVLRVRIDADETGWAATDDRPVADS